MMTLPNLITLSRICLIPVFIGLFYLQPDYVEGKPGEILESLSENSLSWVHYSIVAIFVLISATDFIDGFLARRLNQVSKLGAFLDPVADKLLVCTALILLVDYYHTWYVTIPSVIIISREILVSALREWMSEVGQRANVAVSWIGKLKTFVQMVAIIFLLIHQPLFIFSEVDINRMGFMLLFIATFLTLWSGIKYLIAGLKTFDS
jgi:CDP-diacylglycerol--glycerol-3-phosphate 3-phosphatidyltransferase